jgi:uncharacterized protein (DUF58 family)
MIESPEARPLSDAPWLFGKQGLGLLLIVTLVAATFLANDVTYLAGCLLLVGLMARAWAAVAFARVQYTRRTLNTRAFCGDELILESTVVNPRPLALPWVEVWELLPFALNPQGWRERSYGQPDYVWVERGLSLWPYQRLRWQRHLRCERRGAFRLVEARLRTGDPFGFFERERAWSDRLEVLVYPRVVPIRQLGLPQHHPSIDVVSQRSIVTDPIRTATVRDYQPGDPQRLIHWPTTARRSELHVRVLEPATSLHVSLLLDVRGFGFGIYRGELLESTISALASLAVYLQAAGAPVALLANTRPPVMLPPGASVGHLQQLLESLARLEPMASQPMLPWALGHLPPGNTVILAASDMTPELERGLGELKANSFRVQLLLATTHGPQRMGTYITPGCDLAAVLEGRA